MRSRELPRMHPEGILKFECWYLPVLPDSSGKIESLLGNTLDKVRGIGTVKTVYIAFRNWIN